MTPAELRSAFPRFYAALLARHRSPTPIQLAAAGPIGAGRDTLLMAPTASGKTEAYLVPTLERHLGAHRGPADARILLISPTRALANDLSRRLAERLAHADVDLGRWTGEHHDAGRLHAVTILTPEALDARLSRSPKALADVRALVLDEIHVLDGTARGDQLRILVERLRRRDGLDAPGPSTASRPALQVVAASATVPSPEALAGRYLRDPAIFTAGGRRTIRARIVEDPGGKALSALLQEQVKAGFRKILAFTNSREEVEVLASLLRGRPPFGDAVYAHHGSLARGVRLAAESAFLRAPAAICVATSTLELGIDIGDVDLVLLRGLPPDLPSLLQRAGRGGRRATENHVLALLRGRFEAEALRTMLGAAASGEWYSAPYVFRPGVLVQQALSALHARPSRSMDATALHRRLPPPLDLLWPPARLDDVLLAASRAEWLGPRSADGRYALGAKGERAWSRGQLHANLADKVGTVLHDGLTGDELGTVTTLDSSSVGLGGRARRVLFADEGRVVTGATPGADSLARFSGGLGPSLHASLATALLRGAGIPAPCRARTGGTWVLYHGLGGAGGELLGVAMKGCGFKVKKRGRLAIVLEGEWPERWPVREAIRTALARRFRGLGRRLEMGAFHAVLPDDEQIEAVAAAAEIDRVEALVAAGTPVTVDCTDEELWLEAAFH